MFQINELSPSVTVVTVLEINYVLVISEYVVRVAVCCSFSVTVSLGRLVVFDKRLRSINYNYVIHFVTEQVVREFPKDPGYDNA